MIAPLVTGAVLGLSIALPFGPIALLCVQRSIAAGPGQGIVTGLGASTVHVLYATVAITGAGVVAAELIRWSHLVRLVSAAVLVLLGIRVLVRRSAAAVAVPPIRNQQAFASSFVVALCNPLTVLPYLMVASGSAATATAATALTLWSVPGVFLGTAAWYATISGGAALLRSGLPHDAIRLLDQVAGVLLIGFGVLMAVQ